MNQRQAISEKNEQKTPSIASIESTIDQLHTANSSQQASQRNCGSAQERNISGHVLAIPVATHGGMELPVADASVELYAVSSLHAVASDLPKTVLDHCRTLLLERAQPIDLYQGGGHVVDEPLISFADVLQLREIPGYELLAAAAKSQSDTSFKRLLCSNAAISKPLLCYYHSGSFPAVCAANATTDAAGFFQFTVPQFRDANDQLGYSFIVRHRISSSLYITIYNPTPAAWYTHWDWPIDKMVTLRTRHALAVRGKP